MARRLGLLLILKRQGEMKNKILWLVLILILAAFGRFYRLTTIPPALNWDEVSHGYNAYSILKTGRDEWGMAWPTIFRAYGDYKLPVYIYLTAFFEIFFGLNDFAVRFPSAFAGVLAVLFTFLLARKLLSREGTGSLPLLAALFLAVSPWHIFLSRPAYEANLASFLVMAGTYFFLEAIEKKWLLPVAIFFFGLSVHTYNSARLFTPLLLIFLCLLYYRTAVGWVKKRRGELLVSLILLLLFFIPLVISFISPAGQARWRWVTVIDQGMINRINEARISSVLPGFLPRLIHNKATYLAVISGRNYLSNFSPTYLFLKGGGNYQHNLPGRGIIYPLHAPFILWGLYYLAKNWSKKETRLLLFWWLLAVVPTAATRDNPHVLRTILILPAPQIMAAIGFGQAYKWWAKRVRRSARFVFPVVYGLILLGFIVNFWVYYAGSYRRDYSWSWQYGYQEAASYIKDHYHDYDKIILTKKYGEPHEFLLYFLAWEPSKYQTDPHLVRYFKSNWYWVDSFAKFEFINDWEIKEVLSNQLSVARQLLVTSQGNYPEGWSKIKTINFLNGQPAFEILNH